MYSFLILVHTHRIMLFINVHNQLLITTHTTIEEWTRIIPEGSTCKFHKNFIYAYFLIFLSKLYGTQNRAYFFFSIRMHMISDGFLTFMHIWMYMHCSKCSTTVIVYIIYMRHYSLMSSSSFQYHKIIGSCTLQPSSWALA